MCLKVFSNRMIWGVWGSCRGDHTQMPQEPLPTLTDEGIAATGISHPTKAPQHGSGNRKEGWEDREQVLEGHD